MLPSNLCHKRHSPTKVIFGAAMTFLTPPKPAAALVGTGVGVLVTTVLGAAIAAEDVVDDVTCVVLTDEVVFGGTAVLDPELDTNTGSVDGIGLPSFVCSFTTCKRSLTKEKLDV